MIPNQPFMNQPQPQPVVRNNTMKAAAIILFAIGIVFGLIGLCCDIIGFVCLCLI